MPLRCAASSASKGITHRDLKPDNILVGKAGVKILDFGLAKMDNESSSGIVIDTKPLTAEGTVLGTLHYMSPEQIEGQGADARSDIFAFGLVLYELITGKRAFDGKTRTSLVASILKDQPRPLSELQPLSPPALERVVATCLEKDPDKRWQSAREVKHALEWISSEAPKPVVPAPPPPVPGRRWLWPSIAAVAVVIAGITAYALWPKPAATAPATFQVKLPDNVSFSEYVSVSPDGHKLVFNATGEQSGLWIHDLNTLEWRRLTDTEGGASPFWSPDSRFLGFRVGNQLKKIEIAGGPAQILCSVPQTAGTGDWNRDGVIVFGSRQNGPMYRVSAAGGIPAELTTVEASRGELLHGLPTFLPDGKHFLYSRLGPPDVAGIYVGSLDAKPAEQSLKRILATNYGVRYAGGYLFFLRENTVMAQPFDAGRLQLRGEPVPVAEHVGIIGANGFFWASTNGVLVYRTTAPEVDFQPTWFDRQGKPVGTFGERGKDRGFSLSPDGTRAAVRDASPNQPGDIWRLDFERGVRTRLTFHQSPGSSPVWSPDGSSIIFSAGNTLENLYEKAASGAGEEKGLLKKPSEIKIPTSWSRDGRFLLYNTAITPKTGYDLWVLPLEGERKPVLLLGTEFNERAGSFSPDMRWIAYESNDSGRYEIYVRPFNASGSSGASLGPGKWQVSKDGGTLPKWRADDKEIIFHAPNGSPMAVDVNGTGAEFQLGVPKQLFASAGVGDWDVTADGQRFLIAVPPKQQATDEAITVVMNWQAGLKK